MLLNTRYAPLIRHWILGELPIFGLMRSKWCATSNILTLSLFPENGIPVGCFSHRRRAPNNDHQIAALMHKISLCCSANSQKTRPRLPLFYSGHASHRNLCCSIGWRPMSSDSTASTVAGWGSETNTFCSLESARMGLLARKS